MERTPRPPTPALAPRTNGAEPPSMPAFDVTKEPFQILDTNTGQPLPIRQASDEQVVRSWRAVTQAFQQQHMVITEQLARFGALQGTLTMIEYEIDRRRRLGLVVATGVVP